MHVSWFKSPELEKKKKSGLKTYKLKGFFNLKSKCTPRSYIFPESRQPGDHSCLDRLLTGKGIILKIYIYIYTIAPKTYIQADVYT